MDVQRPAKMKTLRVNHYGPPMEVLAMHEVEVPSPGKGQILVKVHACALNPADWAVCQGFFPVPPPRGIGFDVSGTVEALGEGITTIQVGDRVFGVPDYLSHPTAGASEYAVLKVWVAVPQGLDFTEAATLPMSVETATRALDRLVMSAGQSLVVNGGGTMTGFAAVQMGLMRGLRVIAIAGETFAGRLRELGASIAPYGDGVVERVLALAGGPVDFAFHTARVDGALPGLVRMVGGDPRRVMSISDFDQDGLGVQTSGRERGVVQRYDVLPRYAELAAERRFTIPIARAYSFDDWRDAAARSQSGQAHGKVMLVIDPA
jgi:NADPH:quinone reductase-like Zn-dependent oxidoreductase